MNLQIGSKFKKRSTLNVLKDDASKFLKTCGITLQGDEYIEFRSKDSKQDVVSFIVEKLKYGLSRGRFL